MLIRLMIAMLIGSAVCPAMGGQDEAPIHPGTRAMGNLLSKLWDEWNAGGNPYASSARAERLAEEMEQAGDPGEKLRIQFLLGRELLNAGYNQDAQKILLAGFSILYRNRESVEESSLLEAWQRLGMSHLRGAEVQNCLHNHSSDSCIFPISGEGVHKDERGSQAAIELFASLLKEFPDDLSSKYLLNVAYMTLGQYPESVPSEFQIPLLSMQTGGRIPKFPDVAMKLGVNANGLAGGVVLDDLNGDRRLDILVSSFPLSHPLRCYLNQGFGRFVDASDAMGLKGIGGGLNLVHADYDNDGDQDIFVLRGGWEGDFGKLPNSLLRNDGNAGFADVTIESGVFSKHPTQTAAWGDYNNDGLLDLFIGNESMATRDPRTGEIRLEENPCELFVNLGGGRFRQAAGEAGLDIAGYIKGVAWGDYDNDGFLDLFLSNMQGGNLLFRNLGPDTGGSFRFEERAALAGVVEPVESFPTWWFDYNNDGWLDLFVSGYSATRLGGGLVARDMAIELLGLPREAERLWLYRNNGDGTFTDVAEETGLDKVVYTMGCNYGDLDNDGWLDFYLGTGEPEFSAIVPNRMFRNIEGRKFEEATIHGGFGHLQKGHGIAFGDIDGDGDQDVYAVLGGVAESDTFGNALFRNPGNGNGWITVKLVGSISARDAIGAKIEARLQNGQSQRSVYANVFAGGSFGSSPYQLTIGLGQAQAILDLRVTWPGETAPVSYGPIDLNRFVEITEGTSAPRYHEFGN